MDSTNSWSPLRLGESQGLTALKGLLGTTLEGIKSPTVRVRGPVRMVSSLFLWTQTATASGQLFLEVRPLEAQASGERRSSLIFRTGSEAAAGTCSCTIFIAGSEADSTQIVGFEVFERKSEAFSDISAGQPERCVGAIRILMKAHPAVWIWQDDELSAGQLGVLDRPDRLRLGKLRGMQLVRTIN